MTTKQLFEFDIARSSLKCYGLDAVILSQETYGAENSDYYICEVTDFKTDFSLCWHLHDFLTLESYEVSELFRNAPPPSVEIPF